MPVIVDRCRRVAVRQDSKAAWLLTSTRHPPRLAVKPRLQFPMRRIETRNRGNAGVFAMAPYFRTDHARCANSNPCARLGPDGAIGLELREQHLASRAICVQTAPSGPPAACPPASPDRQASAGLHLLGPSRPNSTGPRHRPGHRAAHGADGVGVAAKVRGHQRHCIRVAVGQQPAAPAPRTPTRAGPPRCCGPLRVAAASPRGGSA